MAGQFRTQPSSSIESFRFKHPLKRRSSFVVRVDGGRSSPLLMVPQSRQDSIRPLVIRISTAMSCEEDPLVP